MRMVRRDRRATIPGAPYAELDDETVIEPEAGPDRRTTAALPIARAELRAAAARGPAHAASEATWPCEARSRDERPRPPREPARPLARGSTPQPPLAAPWIAPAVTLAAAPLPRPAAPLPRAPERFARASSPPPLAAPMVPRPRSSTAPPYPLVTGSAPRSLAPYAPPALPPRSPAAERPIAWGRVFVAVALMSALMGGAIARLAYHPRPASTAATARGAAVAPAPGAAASAPAP
jgi:hypothetical protein